MILDWFAPREPRPVAVYCKYCGSQLEPDDRIIGYDEQTGKAIRPFLDTKVCPTPCLKSRLASQSW